MHEKKRNLVARRRELQDDLEENHQKLESVEDIKVAVAKIYNGTLAGFIKRDKASVLITLLQLAHKLHQKQGPAPMGFVNINIGDGAARITPNFADAKQLDQFLLSDQSASAKLIEDLHRDGNLTIEKQDDVIDVKPINPDKVKIDATGIAKITGAPKEEVIDLLGKTLADTAGEEYAKPFAGIDLLELPPPPPTYCDYVGVEERSELAGMPVLSLWYVCQRCGKRNPNKVQEVCPNG
ncbi:MAG TPA: hypothetical protein V6D22_16925 [Candidatus Obscuribacterales bacterium]